MKVLVTGASRGIGRAVCERLLGRGASVAAVARGAALLADLRSKAPNRVHTIACDLADPEARHGLAQRARDALGGLDAVVAAAGVVAHQPPGAISERSLREQLEIDLVAPLRLGEEALSVLDEGGAMVFVSSTLALRPIASSAVYSAAKAGLQAAARSFALAGAPRRLRVNVVCPGVVDTDMLAARPEKERAFLQSLAPLGGVAQPDEIADAIAYLLDAPHTTGATLVVDGGTLLRE